MSDNIKNLGSSEDMILLVEAAADNGNFGETDIEGGLQFITWATQGTYDSGVVKMQYSPAASGDLWEDVSTVTLSADGIKTEEVNARRIRFNLASVAAAAADIDIYVNIPRSKAKKVAN